MKRAEREVLRSRGEGLEREKRKEEGRREKEAKSLPNCNRNRSSFFIQLVFVFKDLNMIHGPLGVLFIVLCIFTSFSYHR